MTVKYYIVLHSYFFNNLLKQYDFYYLLIGSKTVGSHHFKVSHQNCPKYEMSSMLQFIEIKAK
jgi:hypothetical protein